MKLPAITFLTLAVAANIAFALDPHVEAVIRTVEAAKGKVSVDPAADVPLPTPAEFQIQRVRIAAP